MIEKNKPPIKGGKQKRIEGADYSNTSDHKQRLIRKFPIIRLYAPLFPDDAQEVGGKTHD